MRLDAAFVTELAGLARLSPGPEEAARLASELTRILDYVGQLQQAAPPEDGLSATGATPRRDDVPVDPAGAALFEHSPGRFGRFIRVPVVIGETEP